MGQNMEPCGKVIVLTAAGTYAIAVVRICGSGVEEFLQRHFSRPLRKDQAVHGILRDGGKDLDDPVVLWNQAAQAADICTHGGRWVVHSVVELACREGFEPVDAGLPLPDEAVDAQSMIEREIQQYLPMARTREAIRTLLNQKDAWAALDDSLVSSSAILADKSLYWLLHAPRVAIIGIPNAGKSTLANALFDRDRNIVSDAPGTTRDYVEDFANLGGLPVKLLDTPGLRHSTDSIEAEAIQLSREPIASADLQILLIDSTQDPAPQTDLIDQYPSAMVVGAKTDLASLPPAMLKKARAQTDIAGEVVPLRISARSGEGLSNLNLAIRRHFGCEVLPHSRPCAWTDRQRQLLNRT
jgi:small GTP-binding protein